jgi:uncharacterized protein YbbC (DUF1343 family)
MDASPSFGIDVFLQRSVYKGRRIALVTNEAASTKGGIPSRVALLQNGFLLVKLFSPEHGLSARGVDGAFQKHVVDTATGLPVISLYGDQLAPTKEDLQDVDLVLFDIPDVGCRFYTYLWTLSYVMEACAAYGKPLVVADRSNPIGGDLALVEGPWLDEAHCASFIGRWNIPLRHCCTLGELAQYFAAFRIQNLQLQVVKVEHWERNQVADPNHFIPPSPAIQDPETALLYPGTGLLEGVLINEGRGTEQPFRMCGAPWINGEALAEAYLEKSPPGLHARTCSFTPSEGVYAGELCQGLAFSVTDPSGFCPVAAGIRLLQTLACLYPQQLRERLYCTRANPSGAAHLDKLLGVKGAFEQIKTGAPFLTEVGQEWRGIIKPYLLYPS